MYITAKCLYSINIDNTVAAGLYGDSSLQFEKIRVENENSDNFKK